MAEKYTEGIGRRKNAVARVRITPAAKNTVLVNRKAADEYFPAKEYVTIAAEPLSHEDIADTFDVSVKVSGGGMRAQADAVRHGLARAIVILDEKKRGVMKEEGYLKRDARIKERKKPGLKKARKAPQWSKR